MGDSPAARSRADVFAELALAKAEHSTSKGQAKGRATRAIKALEAELASLPVDKRWAKGQKFDSASIVAKATELGTGTGQELADALGLPYSGAFKRRVNWLATKDQLIDESFTS